MKVNVPIRTHHQDDILSETEVASSEEKNLETPNYVIRVVVLLTPHWIWAMHYLPLTHACTSVNIWVVLVLTQIISLFYVNKSIPMSVAIPREIFEFQLSTFITLSFGSLNSWPIVRKIVLTCYVHFVKLTEFEIYFIISRMMGKKHSKIHGTHFSS